jgi:DNA polymerase V
METGFPSPAQGYEAEELDLTAMLIKKPSATYLMEMSGRALESVGIYPHDLLIADRSRKPKPDSIVIAEYQGEFVCRVLKKGFGGVYRLIGQGVPAIEATDEVRIIAVVPYSIRRFP